MPRHTDCHEWLQVSLPTSLTGLSNNNSQGAQVVSKAMDQLTAAEASTINAVVLFGNPNGEDPVPNTNAADVEVFCNAGDLICEGRNTILPPHLAYGSDADAAADFVESRLQ